MPTPIPTPAPAPAPAPAPGELDALDLLHTIAGQLADDGPVEVGTMFRSPGLRTGSKIFAFLGHHDDLIIKLPRVRAAALVATGAAEPVTMGTRTMREWVTVAGGTDPDATLASWSPLAREAMAYVAQLG